MYLVRGDQEKLMTCESYLGCCKYLSLALQIHVWSHYCCIWHLKQTNKKHRGSSSALTLVHIFIFHTQNEFNFSFSVVEKKIYPWHSVNSTQFSIRLENNFHVFIRLMKRQLSNSRIYAHFWNYFFRSVVSFFERRKWKERLIL